MNEIQVFDLHPFFEEVQMQRIFPDGKTFVDCTPKESLVEINKKYLLESVAPNFNLKEFVLRNFELPVVFSTGYQTDINAGVEAHLERLWDTLTRKPDSLGGSLIPLPNPYIVPGGRFGEIYYWDSYFTMLGLKASGRVQLIQDMVDNFSFLIDKLGYIPNGNRTYFLGRSQPPFYAMMLELLSEVKGEEVLLQYLPYLEKEYQYWMQGSDELTKENRWEAHTALMPDGEVLNRYYDTHGFPRPEAYRHEAEVAAGAPGKVPALYRHLRGAAESGWDFSSRWYSKDSDFSSTHTTDIVPIDLNCLLYKAETVISTAYRLARKEDMRAKYAALAEVRKEAIIKYCWNKSKNFYFDYDAALKKQKTIPTAAAFFPLFFKIATEEQARKMLPAIKKDFLGAGGILTTLNKTGQQWDSPNGWAPLQWATIIGLENYDHDDLAIEIAQRWIKMNIAVFKRTGKMMEKYNVVDLELDAGGGEYTGQDGFGWTNGVLLALMKKYGV